MKIANKNIDRNDPCFIIAEAGVNHNGSVELAYKLIDNAKVNHADAIKFQYFKADDLILPDTKKTQYQIATTGEGTQYDMLKSLEFNDHDFLDLMAYANDQDIIFLSSAFDWKGFKFLYENGIPAFKIPSGELTNLPLLSYIRQFKKPVILSTGMARLWEIREAVYYLDSYNLVILHCVSEYPAPLHALNLSFIHDLDYEFDVPIGFSDHSVGILASFLAVSVGAKVIEKHFTLDKTMEGPDHQTSINPLELNTLVRGIRKIEVCLGNGRKVVSSIERENLQLVRKSIVSKLAISEGTAITSDMIYLKRPGNGIPPRYWNTIVGKIANNNILANSVIKCEDILW